MLPHLDAIKSATTYDAFKIAFEKANNAAVSRTPEMRDAIFKNRYITVIDRNDSSISAFSIYISFFVSVNAGREILLQDATLHRAIHDLLVVSCLGKARTTKCISDVFKAIGAIVAGCGSANATAAQLFASQKLFDAFKTNVLPQLKKQNATHEELNNIAIALGSLIANDTNGIIINLFATEEMMWELQSIFPVSDFQQLRFMTTLQNKIRENYAKENLPMIEPGSDGWKLAEDFQECTDPTCKNGKFGILLRPHHCRVCGDVFCDDHAPKKTVVCQQGVLKVEMQLRCCFKNDCATKVDKGYIIHLPPPPTIDELKKRLEENCADPGDTAMTVIEKLAEANDDSDSSVAGFFDKVGDIVPAPFGSAFKAIAAVASLVNKVFASRAACKELAARLCRLQPAMAALGKLKLDITQPIADRILEVAQQCRALIEKFVPKSQEEKEKESLIRSFVGWCSGVVTALKNPAEDFAKLHQQIDRLLQDYVFAVSVDNSIHLNQANVGGGVKFTSDALMQNFYRKTAADAGDDLQTVVKVLQQQNYQFAELKSLTEKLSNQIEQLRKEMNNRFDEVMKELRSLRREVRGEVVKEEKNEPIQQQQQTPNQDPLSDSTKTEKNQPGKSKDGCSCVIC